MRSFPSAVSSAFSRAGRPKLTASCVALAATCAIAIPLAHAADEDDLKDKQRRVQNQIERTHDHLEDMSVELARATRRVAAAEQRLATARAHLNDVEGRLVAARERDAQLKAELAEAEAALEQANADLAAGQEAVAQQRINVRDQVLNQYTTGAADPQLRAFGSLFENASLDQMADRILAEGLITGAGANTYELLQEIEAQLAAQQDDVAAAKRAVAEKKREAAAHLEEMRGLYDQARSAKLRVDALVAKARSARQAAIKARQRDRQVLARLKKEEQRVKEKLLELARRDNRRGYRGTTGGLLEWPAPGPMTSPYGYRIHPIYGDRRLHTGMDIGAPCGSGAVAAASGTVIDEYYSSSYGNRLFLSIGNINGKNVVLTYNHLSAFVASEGERVERGEVIARTGTTGWSTGCHLHFEVLEDGNFADPAGYL